MLLLTLFDWCYCLAFITVIAQWVVAVLAGLLFVCCCCCLLAAFGIVLLFVVVFCSVAI